MAEWNGGEANEGHRAEVPQVLVKGNTHPIMSTLQQPMGGNKMIS
jgi:hypothetical protein